MSTSENTTDPMFAATRGSQGQQVDSIAPGTVPPKLDSIEPEAGGLLPCPFCGGEAESDHLRGYLTMMGGRLDHGAAIYCTSCHADMMICRADTREWSDEERMAVLREAWNRRASPAPVAVPAGYRVAIEALEPFADVGADASFARHPDSYAPRPSRGKPNMGHYRAAFAALVALLSIGEKS